MTNSARSITVIAEVGSNHNGDLDTALELIDVSAQCGADIVKFQSFLADELLAAGDPTYDTQKKLELKRDWYPVLMARCKEQNVKFLSTATNETTPGWMEQFGADGYKVASCNISHQPLIDRLVEIGKPIIVSTGMATKDEIVELADYLDHGPLKGKFAFLHCVSEYPTKPTNARLGNIATLNNLLPCPVGLSDHTLGIYAPIAATALGAKLIEKHISLDKSGLGLDHEVALLPDEFAAMCEAIRNTEAALFEDFSPNTETIFQMRRSIRFNKDIKAGEIITEQDLKITRPEDGLLPKHLPKVIGKKIIRDGAAGEPVTWQLIEGAAG